MATLTELVDAIIVGNARRARELATQALAEGTSPQEIVDRAVVPAMDVVGDRFKRDEYFLPEVLLSARAAQETSKVVRPYLGEGSGRSLGRVVIGTVKGDMHDIGKNLVAMMLAGAGFAVTDLGLDVAPERFVAAAREQQADLVCLSSLVTTTMASMRETVQALEEAGIRSQVKVMVGGAPVTQRFADQIGADGYAPDAARAVDRAKELLRERQN